MFNILYFVKVHYAEQEMVAESIYLRTLRLSMDKGSDTNCSATILPAPCHAKAPGTSTSYPVSELCTSVQKLQSCSRISGFIWGTLTMPCCFRKRRFSSHLLAHLILLYFNTSAQLHCSAWIAVHGISSAEKSSCKGLKLSHNDVWTAESEGNKTSSFLKICKL